MSSENVHATISATSKMPKIRQNFKGYEHTTPAQSFNRSFVPWANKNQVASSDDLVTNPK